MALNPNYVPLTPLWEVFTDKDLLTFLRDGYVKFYQDTARTVGKPVYKLTGSPPNYSYIQYGFLDTDGAWRVDMNDQGAFSEVIYGFPLDSDGNVDLYFAQFFSSTGVFQFSREGFPNFFNGSVTPSTPVDINFIPNGQFLLHTDIPPNPPKIIGEVQEPITQVAFGNWTFERPISSTARDFVTFDRIGSYVTTPEKSPRYTIRINSQAPSAGDQFKDLRVKFDDVNKFSSATQMYTFAITAKVISGGATPVDLIIVKNFGTGGSAQTETNLTTFNITGTFTVFSFSFVFGANTGFLIGGLNDDFVQLALRFPTNGLFDIELTDAILTIGNISIPGFNDTTTKEFIYQSMFDDMVPAYDGNNLGLPLVLTKTGLRYDDSTVGLIYPSVSYSLGYGFLICDGTSYDSTLHSSDGIPYKRLRDKIVTQLTTLLWPLDFEIPTFGTGENFVSLYVNAIKDVEMATNKAGATAVPSDGLVPTGFTFKSNHMGQTNVDAKGYVSQGFLYIISDLQGVVTPPDIGTISGTVEVLVNGSLARSVIKVIPTGVTAGSYFTFSTTTQKYLVWFKLDGAGTIPSVPGTVPIEVDLFTGMNIQDVSNIIADSVSGKQITQITTLAASGIPQSSYFDFSTTSQAYYGWINKDNGGTDPLLTGKIGIEIPIASSDTKDQVTSKVATAINLRYFAVPDLRGIFLKGFDGDRNNDLDKTLRYATNSVIYGNAIGSSEYSNNISHTHNLYDATAPTTFSAYTFNTGTTPQFTNAPREIKPPTYNGYTMSNDGASESRPENIYVNYVIKY